MILPDSNHEKLLHDLAPIYPHGASRQGMREMVHTVVGSVGNSFRSAGMKISLGVECDGRSLTALVVFAGCAVHMIPMSIQGDLLAIGADSVRLARGDAVPSLVKALFRAVEAAVRS
jgi:hypothetical protein